MAALGIFFILNGGIFLMMKLWIFPWVNMVALLVFFPSGLFNWLDTYCNAFFTCGNTIDRIKSSLLRWFSKKPSLLNILLPQQPVKINPSRFSSFCVIFLLSAVIYWNLSVILSNHLKVPRHIQKYYFLLNIHQNWMMFQRPEQFVSGWLLVAGTLKSGQQIDLLDKGAPLNPDTPRSSKYFRKMRWRRFISVMNRGGYWRSGYRFLNYAKEDLNLRPHLAQYMCRSANSRQPHHEQLEKVQYISIARKVVPGRETQPPFKKRVAFEHACSNKR